MTKAVRGANLLFKSMEVLDAVAEAPAPVRLTELTVRTGLPAGTLHRILDALVAGRFLRKDGNRTYRLGSRLLQLARRSWEDFDLRGAAEPELHGLYDVLGETVTLGVLIDGAVVVIDKVEGQNALRTSAPLGQTLPMHCTAIGKTILAALEPAERARTLAMLGMEPRTPTTVTDRMTLRAHLEMMSARRYAIEDEEHVEGVRGVAAAILDQRGSPIGAIGVSGPGNSLALERLLEIGPMLTEAALRVSWNLGFTPPEPWPGFSIAAKGTDPVALAVPAAAFSGTSPVWQADTGTLYWVDHMRPSLHRSCPATGHDEEIRLPGNAGSVAPATGGLLVAMREAVALLDPSGTAIQPLFSLMGREMHQRYNTARCDSRGRLWITTMDLTISRASGRLYRVDRDLGARCMMEDLLVPIGMGWSPDERRMYFCDAPRREIYRYEYDPQSGEFADPRLFARIAEGAGRPTGLAVDRAGFVWNLQTDGWCVTRYDPDGRIDRVVSLPVPKPIDCCFGGPDMRTLFITTARVGLPERRLAEVPWSGGVLAYDCPEPGLPIGVFPYS